MSPKTPTRRSPPVLLLSMVTGQMFTTGSEEWGRRDKGTRGQGEGETRGQEISVSLSPCPLVSHSPSTTGSCANGFDNAKGGCRANHARQLEPRGREKRIEFGFSSLASAGHHHHVQVQELAQVGLIAVGDDHFNQQQLPIFVHRPMYIFQNGH